MEIRRYEVVIKTKLSTMENGTTIDLNLEDTYYPVDSSNDLREARHMLKTAEKRC